jgi:hypothetical protein
VSLTENAKLTVSIPQPKQRNGACFYQLLACPTTTHLATVTVNDKEKLVFHNSTFVIDFVTNSWKYGCELQFNCYSREPPTLEKRVDKEHNYFRCETAYLEGSHESAEKLRRVADQIDFIIGYNKPEFVVNSKVLTGKSNVAELLC